MARPMRRVVTGHNAQGKSVVLADAPSPHALELDGMPGLALINLWVTNGAPASNAGAAAAAARPVVLDPPELGTILRVVDFPPDKGMAGRVDRAKAFAAMGAGHAMDQSDARHPAMHKTNTIRSPAPPAPTVTKYRKPSSASYSSPGVARAWTLGGQQADRNRKEILTSAERDDGQPQEAYR